NARWFGETCRPRLFTAAGGEDDHRRNQYEVHVAAYRWIFTLLELDLTILLRYCNPFMTCVSKLGGTNHFRFPSRRYATLSQTADEQWHYERDGRCFGPIDKVTLTG